MKRIRIKVTKKNIKQGIRLNSIACPIALALMDKGYDGVANQGFIYIDNKQYHSTKRADAFMIKFDNGGKVKPATFVFRAV